MSVEASKVDKLLGLFTHGHMEFNLLSDQEVQPSLTEMIAKSLTILKKNEKGFVLLVEGGRIDSAHHQNMAKLALDETHEFQKAVALVREQTNEKDTLLVVTADHSAALSVTGYMVRKIWRDFRLKMLKLDCSLEVTTFLVPVTFREQMKNGFLPFPMQMDQGTKITSVKVENEFPQEV
jgi:alkaline phosphatase